MTEALLWILAGVASYVVTTLVAAQIALHAPMRRRNYRALDIPTAGGIAVLAGLILSAGAIGFVKALSRDSVTTEIAWTLFRAFLPISLGFGLLGLWDDIAGGPERGWRPHLSSLARGRPTSGALKLACGFSLSFFAAIPNSKTFLWTLVNAAVLALMANLFNLLDVRPGRAGKAFVVAAIPLMVIGAVARPPLAAALGGVLAFLPFDLRERAMLGDVGANGLGAVIGLAVIAFADDMWTLIVLGILVVLHLVADKPGLSRIITAVPPLHAADQWGRVPEQPTTAEPVPPESAPPVAREPVTRSPSSTPRERPAEPAVEVRPDTPPEGVARRVEPARDVPVRPERKGGEPSQPAEPPREPRPTREIRFDEDDDDDFFWREK